MMAVLTCQSPARTRSTSKHQVTRILAPWSWSASCSSGNARFCLHTEADMEYTSATDCGKPDSVAMFQVASSKHTRNAHVSPSMVASRQEYRRPLAPLQQLRDSLQNIICN